MFDFSDEGMHYEGYCIRPPSEAHSILLQVTLGCSHNKCTFCGTFTDKPFRIKDEETILSDIKYASSYMQHQDRLFLMDGDALIIPQKRLMWILDQIKAHLPWVKRVGAYANTKGIKLKSVAELAELREKMALVYCTWVLKQAMMRCVKRSSRALHQRVHRDGQKGKRGRDKALCYCASWNSRKRKIP